MRWLPRIPWFEMFVLGVVLAVTFGLIGLLEG